jgi:hypothetical protein
MKNFKTFMEEILAYRQSMQQAGILSYADILKGGKQRLFDKSGEGEAKAGRNKPDFLEPTLKDNITSIGNANLTVGMGIVGRTALIDGFPGNAKEIDALLNSATADLTKDPSWQEFWNNYYAGDLKKEIRPGSGELVTVKENKKETQDLVLTDYKFRLITTLTANRVAPLKQQQAVLQKEIKTFQDKIKEIEGRSFLWPWETQDKLDKEVANAKANLNKAQGQLGIINKKISELNKISNDIQKEINKKAKTVVLETEDIHSLKEISRSLAKRISEYEAIMFESVKKGPLGASNAKEQHKIARELRLAFVELSQNNSLTYEELRDRLLEKTSGLSDEMQARISVEVTKLNSMPLTSVASPIKKPVVDDEVPPPPPPLPPTSPEIAPAASGAELPKTVATASETPSAPSGPSALASESSSSAPLKAPSSMADKFSSLSDALEGNHVNGGAGIKPAVVNQSLSAPPPVATPTPVVAKPIPVLKPAAVKPAEGKPNSERTVTLKDIYKDAFLYKTLHDFSVASQTQDNISFLIAVEELRKLGKSIGEGNVEFQNMAKNLYDQFIPQNAPQQVNISSVQRKLIEAENDKNPPVFTIAKFEVAQAEIEKMTASDSFARFLNSDELKQYKKIIGEQAEMVSVLKEDVRTYINSHPDRVNGEIKPEQFVKNSALGELQRSLEKAKNLAGDDPVKYNELVQEAIAKAIKSFGGGNDIVKTLDKTHVSLGKLESTMRVSTVAPTTLKVGAISDSELQAEVGTRTRTRGQIK